MAGPLKTKPRRRKPGVNHTEQRQRENEAMRLHVAGMTLAQIGERFGCHEATVSRMISRGLDRATFEGARALRRRQAERLELLHGSAMRVLGDAGSTFDQRLRAIAQAVRVSDAVTRLYGLNAPERVRFEADMDKVFETLRSLLKEDEFEQVAEAIARRDSGEAPGAEPGGPATPGSAPLPN